MATFTKRMIGAAKLDILTYEEVESDKTAFPQAMGVVVLSSIASGVGLAGREGALGLVAGVIMALVSWMLWAWITYFIGTKLLPEPKTDADFGQLLRTTGFAAIPGILIVLHFLPGVGVPVLLVAGIWKLACFVVAVRQALDYSSTWRAVAVCMIGFLPTQWILFLAVGAISG